MEYSRFLLCALLSSATGMFGSSEQSASLSDELSSADKECFAWFESTAKALPSTMQALSAQDKEVYQKGLKITDHPEEVIRSRNNYVDIFFAQAAKANIPPKYDAQTLKPVMLKVVKALHTKSVEKPTDLLTARTYVYTRLLTPEEQATWKEAAYLAHPEEAHQVAKKFSTLVVQELAKLKPLEYTDEVKRAKIDELYAEKVDRLKKTYPPAPALSTLASAQ